MGLGDISISLKDIDRKKASAILGAFFAFVVIAGGAYAVSGRYASIKRMTAAKKEDLKKFREAEEEYLKKKAVLETVAKKAYSTGAEDSPVAVIEDMGARAGIKGRITSIKPLEEREVLGYRERGVEVKMERVDLNQLVNLLYLMDNNRVLIVVKEFSMKSRFEDPNLLDVTMKLAEISKIRS